MSQLEDFVSKHRDEFDDQEPSLGHMDAFEQKLQFATSQKSKSVRFPIAQVAAAVIFVVASLVLFHELNFEDKQYSKGIRIIKSNYDNILESRYKQINLAMDKLPDSVRECYEQQIKEMQEQTKALEKTISENPSVPEVEQTLLQHYQKTNRALTRLAVNAERINANCQN